MLARTERRTLAACALLVASSPGCSAGKDDTSSATNGADQGDPPYIVINEILAENVTTNTDDLKEFDDWIELYNPGDTVASLKDTFLTDDPNIPAMWAFPQDATVEPHGFLLLWCDDATGSEGLHASFKLDKAGDQVLIYYIHGAADPLRLDWIEFGAQLPDLTIARVPDGSSNLVEQATPTPAASNGS